jgi:hypothetical protein
MVHGPCGAENPNAPCMVDNGRGGKICSKGFPKSFREFTTMDQHGYPLYFRPDDGRAYEVNGRMVDNRWIVPIPPFLCAEFSCHINMECAVTLGTFKYAFKYVHKGPDRGALERKMKSSAGLMVVISLHLMLSGGYFTLIHTNKFQMSSASKYTSKIITW